MQAANFSRPFPWKTPIQVNKSISVEVQASNSSIDSVKQKIQGIAPFLSSNIAGLISKAQGRGGGGA